jgi:hypothetical protein
MIVGTPFAATVVALLLLCSAAPFPHPSHVVPPSHHVSFGPLRPWLSPAFFPAAPEPRASMHDWFSAALASVKAWALHAKSNLPTARVRAPHRSDGQDLYWRFIPPFQAAIVPGADAHWNTTCWAHVSASASASDAALVITVSASHRLGPAGCRDAYLLATVEGFHILEVASDLVHVVHWSLANASAADLAWIARNGVRAFRFMDDLSLTLDELLHTVRAPHPPCALAPICAYSVALLEFVRLNCLNPKYPRVGTLATPCSRPT